MSTATTTPPAGSSAPRATDQKAKTQLARAGKWARRAPLLPALIFVILMTQLPFLATLVISFMNWNAYYPDERGFAGFDNFKRVFTDVNARQAVVVTILLTLAVVLISLLLGLGIAMLLDRKFRGRGIVRTLMITPFLIVPIAAALLWKHALYNPEYGLFNGALKFVFGDNAPQPDWISNNPLWAIIAALVWQWTPFMMLILLAGLQSRDPEIMEAATVDGANAWQMFRNMTLPHMRRYIELSATLGTIFIVQNFDSVVGMTGGQNSTNIPYEIYQVFYSAKDYGAASALGVVVVFGSIIIATFGLRVVSSLLTEETSG